MSDTRVQIRPGEKNVSVHAIDDLVRLINPESFSESVHGSGHRVVLVDKRGGPYHKQSVFGKLFGRRDEKHYFVKNWTVPKEVKGWQFHWSEGTNAISLDFEASFIIQANEDVHAYQLVEVLAEPPSPGEALYNIINGALNKELNRMLKESSRNGLSLLDIFKRSSIGVGESDELNAKVSESVRATLGGATFRIGFQLHNAPPIQVEVRRIGVQADPFTLADSRRQRMAETTALLKLDNFQTFKKSGLHTEDDVRMAIGRAITEAVKELLFARKYYDVVRSFSQGSDSIVHNMRHRVEDEARSIGYSVKMFQTLPDIAALRLLEPVRIDIAANEEKYDLKNSVGYVQFSVSLITQIGSDVSRLDRLIVPDAEDVADPIAACVRQICRDRVQRFNHQDCNLNFEDKVVPVLQAEICKGLANFGLSTQIINIRQAPTEDAQRFKAIRGRTIDFDASIKPHANRGQADAVPVTGTIEVIGVVQTGWESFQSKDFGYRSDSHLTEQRMHALADQLHVHVPTGSWSDAERRSIAVDLELTEIRQRVVGVLEGQMSMGPDLAEHWTNASNSKQISAWAETLAANAINAEFGLAIKIRGFGRRETATDITAQTTRDVHHTVVREAARRDAENVLEYEAQKRNALDKKDLALIETLGRRERDAVDDPESEEGKAVTERVQAELKSGANRPRHSSADALAALKSNLNHSVKELPWVITTSESSQKTDKYIEEDRHSSESDDPESSE